MTRKYTKKNRFQSKYSDKDVFVSDHQYLAELMCEKIALREGVKLTYKFWSQSRWKGTFVLQCKHASILLKDYRVFDIIEALKDVRCRKVYSLGARYLLDNVIKDVIKNKRAVRVIRTIEVADDTNIRPVLKKQNPMGDL